jgi:predicted nucleic acid-binding protein
MTQKYYFDTSIWVDLYEDRKGYYNEPLGEFALRLFTLIKARKDKLIITDYLVRELEANYSREEINRMLRPFESIIEHITATKEQREEAKKLAKERNVPRGDALHAIIARDNKLTLITRDKHFKRLEDIFKHYKPEELI